MGRRKGRDPHRRTPPGAPPGTLVVDPDAPRPKLRVIAFGPTDIVDRQIDDPRRLADFAHQWPVTWLNVDGLGDAQTIAKLGEIFDLHPLAIEDVINVHQRAKVDQYPKHEYIVARMLHLYEHVETEQLSLFLGKDYVLTFQEGRPGDPFDPVRERLRKKPSKLRSGGPDYLAYALLDALIDQYFPVLEVFGDRLEDLELQIMEAPGPRLLAGIHEAKRNLITLRRAIWPLREMTSQLTREASPRITEETRLYLRDCYDHTVQILDLVENYRELSSDLTDVFLSSTGNRLNEIMKVLTIFTAIFIPLSFIAGVYGMNFDPDTSPLNMPELRWFWGYPFALGVMALTAAVLLGFFWSRGWLGAPVPARARVDQPERIPLPPTLPLRPAPPPPGTVQVEAVAAPAANGGTKPAANGSAKAPPAAPAPPVAAPAAEKRT